VLRRRQRLLLSAKARKQRRLSLFDPIFPLQFNNSSTDESSENTAHYWDIGLLLAVPAFVFVAFFAIVCVFIRVFEHGSDLF